MLLKKCTSLKYSVSKCFHVSNSIFDEWIILLLYKVAECVVACVIGNEENVVHEVSRRVVAVYRDYESGHGGGWRPVEGLLHVYEKGVL